MNVPRAIALALAALALALSVAACGDDEGDKTVTETVGADTTATDQTASTESTEVNPETLPSVTEKSGGAAGDTGGVTAESSSAGPSRGPKYFQTPSENIGCYISAHDARCDIRERSWEPPPEPNSCKKIGLDYGQGIVVGPNHAEFICAGDTALGGPATLGYGSNARRGNIRCHSGQKGITCSNAQNGHGFFLSRESYRIF